MPVAPPLQAYGSSYGAPPELYGAIETAAHQYQVPDWALFGIWKEESGGKYPNPYVNSSGYGGLFGTRDWGGPTQEQANLAASTLATGLKQSKGDITGALSYYNTGQVQSPAGQSYGHTVEQLAGHSGGGFWKSLPGNIFQGITGIPPSLFGGAEKAVGGAAGSVFDSITDPIAEALLRGAFVLGGLLVSLLGLYLLSRSFGGPTPRFPLGALAEGYVGGRASQRTPARASGASPELQEAKVRTESERTKEVRSRRRAQVRGYIEGKLDQ